MNALQLRKHWIEWSAVCRVNGWKPSDDEQRYAAYRAALKLPDDAPVSSKMFDTDKKIDALYDHFAQLKSRHTSLRAAIRQSDQDHGDRHRRIHAITHRHDEAMWRHIAADKFQGEEDLNQLNLHQLTQLRDTCDRIAAAKKRNRLEPYNRTAAKRVGRDVLSAPEFAESDDALECGVSTPPLESTAVTNATANPF